MNVGELVNEGRTVLVACVLAIKLHHPFRRIW
jgi:hypothetical protein